MTHRADSRAPLRGALPALLLAGLASVAAGPLQGQAPSDDLRLQIQESQRRLEQVRQERAQLQQEMDLLRSRVQNVSGELQNIERQLSASRSVAAEIEFQVEATTARIERNTAELLRTREQLRERQAILNRRLRDIYKGGPLHTARVVLGASSFADLLNRIRYLQTIAAYDRILFGNVSELESALEDQNAELQRELAELSRLRSQRQNELAELREIESAHQRTLQQFRSQESRNLTRLDQLEADELRLSGLVAEMDRRRVEEERRRAVAGPSAAGAAPPAGALSTLDIGVLDWPVEGPLAYSFGVERRPNGTVLRWNGIGIRAPLGTPVRAVRAGTVALAGPFEGYGPSVILSHGGGYYTLYLYLEEVGVVEGRSVAEGQVVGTVGGAGTPEGPRLEFQLRAPVDGGIPQALDPLRWLRPRNP